MSKVGIVEEERTNPGSFARVSQMNYNTTIIIFHSVALLKLPWAVEGVVSLRIIADPLAAVKNERERTTLVLYGTTNADTTRGSIQDNESSSRTLQTCAINQTGL